MAMKKPVRSLARKAGRFWRRAVLTVRPLAAEVGYSELVRRKPLAIDPVFASKFDKIWLMSTGRPIGTPKKIKSAKRNVGLAWGLVERRSAIFTRSPLKGKLAHKVIYLKNLTNLTIQIEAHNGRVMEENSIRVKMGQISLDPAEVIGLQREIGLAISLRKLLEKKIELAESVL